MQNVLPKVSDNSMREQQIWIGILEKVDGKKED